MSQTVTITLTDTQYKSMEYAAVSVSDWVENSTVVRADKAKAEIISILVDHCNENDIQLAVGSDAQVTQAFDLGLVDKAADRDTTPVAI